MKFVFRETLKFAARFLQIPRHHGHPCVKLTVTSAFTARDLHPIDYIHARRTSSRRERLTPVLSHHRTYGSVYGGSIKIIDASLYITSVNSCSLYASGHSTLQEVSHGIHRFLPRVRYCVFCVHHDALNAKGYSLLIVRSFLVVLDQLIL